VSSANTYWTDERLDRIIGSLLRAGVIITAFVVMIGATVYLARHGADPADRRSFHGEPENLETVSGIILESFRLSGRGLIQLGLLILIATPVARVMFSVFAFAWQRDWLYVIFTLIVLGVVCYSLF
jgi:uncharacterized membrane protein